MQIGTFRLIIYYDTLLVNETSSHLKMLELESIPLAYLNNDVERLGSVVG